MPKDVTDVKYLPKADVSVNAAQELYVIREGDGWSSLGFDVCLDRIERFRIELEGRGCNPHLRLTPARGSLETYALMEVLQTALKSAVEKDGEKQAVADLSPQLIGLEGWRVEVVDAEGDEPRRFIVGKSTGWLPIHLEIRRSDSSGGMGARREYHSVRELERVR